MEEIERDPDGLRWIKNRETGEVLPVENDREFLDAIIAFHREECAHPEKRVMRVKVGGGAIQVRECCTTCGAGFGNALRQDDRAWVSSLPSLPASVAWDYQKGRKEAEYQMILQHALRQFEERGRFTHRYRQYLASPEWASLRHKVIARCGNVCEGCASAPVQEVHHVTYEHFGREFLFELLGLCRACHDRLHAEDSH